MKVGDKSAKVGTTVVRQCAVTRERRPESELLRFVLDGEGRVTPDIKRRLPGRGVWVTANHGVVAEAVKRGVLVRALKTDGVLRSEAGVPDAGVSGARKLQPVEGCVDRDDLPALAAALLRRSALGSLSLANKAGCLTLGFEAVARTLAAGGVMGVIHAAEAAQDGRRKLDRLFLRDSGEGRRRPVRWLGGWPEDCLGGSQGRDESGASAAAGTGSDDGGKADEPPLDGRERNERFIVGLFSGEELSQALGRGNVTHAALKEGGASANFLKEALRLSKYLEPAPAKPSKRRSKQDKV